MKVNVFDTSFKVLKKCIIHQLYVFFKHISIFNLRYRSASLPRSFLKKPVIQSTVCNNNR